MKTGVEREAAKWKPRGRLFWLKRFAVALLLSLLLLFLREVVLLLTRETYDGTEGDPLRFLSIEVLREAFKPGLLFYSLGAVFLFALLRSYVSCIIVAVGEYVGAVNWFMGTVYPKNVPAHRVGDEHVLLALRTPIAVYSFCVTTGIAIAVTVYAIARIYRKVREENGKEQDGQG